MRLRQKARWLSVFKVLLPKWGGSRSYRQLKESVDWFCKSDVWPTRGVNRQNSCLFLYRLLGTLGYHLSFCLNPGLAEFIWRVPNSLILGARSCTSSFPVSNALQSLDCLTLTSLVQRQRHPVVPSACRRRIAALHLPASPIPSVSLQAIFKPAQQSQLHLDCH